MQELRKYFERDFTYIYGNSLIISISGDKGKIKGFRIKDLSVILTRMPTTHQAIFYNRERTSPFDLKYAILSDRDFTYKIAKTFGISNTVYVNKVFGKFYLGGFSGLNNIAFAKERYRLLKDHNQLNLRRRLVFFLNIYIRYRVSLIERILEFTSNLAFRRVKS